MHRGLGRYYPPYIANVFEGASQSKMFFLKDGGRLGRVKAYLGLKLPISVEGQTAVSPGIRTRWCIPHPPGPIFHARYLHSWNSAAVPKRSGLEPSRRELSKDVSIGIGTLLVVGQSLFEIRPRGS